MTYQTKQFISNILSILLIIGIVVGVCALIRYDYHHDKAECFANGGIWSERMSTGDDGFSWKCTYNPHMDVNLK
jgi:hypothetical protein